MTRMNRGSTFGGALSLLVGLGAVAAVVFWVTRPPALPDAAPPRPPFLLSVTVAPVAIGDVHEQVELVGDVAAPERARIAFERAGRLLEVSVRLGDVVRSGAPLARLDDAVMEKLAQAAAAELAEAQEQSAMAGREAERVRKIGDTVASASELDHAESLARSEQQRVAKLAADVDVAKARLAQGVLVAPFDALVTGRTVSVGTYVAAGDACFELLSLDHRDVLLEVPAGVAAAARPDATVTLTSDALPGFSLDAKLHALLPAAQARARTFTGVVRLGAEDDPQRRLLPGMFVRAVMQLRSAQGACVVPVDALLLGEIGPHLAVARPDPDPAKPPTTAFVPVRVLARDDASAAVEPLANAELKAGDLVVLTGKENVFPGAMLIPSPATGAAAAPTHDAPGGAAAPARRAGSGA